MTILFSQGKSADDADYANKQAHVELAMRMKKRDPGITTYHISHITYQNNTYHINTYQINTYQINTYQINT